MNVLEIFDQAKELISNEDGTLQAVKDELHGLIDDVMQMYEIGEDAAATGRRTEALQQNQA